MKIEVETKITFLDGEEKGKIISEKQITDTQQQITEYGIIEHFTLAWKYLRSKHIKEYKNDN